VALGPAAAPTSCCGTAWWEVRPAGGGVWFMIAMA
jgi:hypothetical protein